MGDADIKGVTSSRPHSIPPWVCSTGTVLTKCHIAAQLAPSEGGSGQGQAEQSWSGAVLCGGALQHPTSHTLEGPCSCCRSCATSLLLGVTHKCKVSEFCWGISFLWRQRREKDNMGYLFCDSLLVAVAVKGKTEQGLVALPPVCTSPKVSVPSRVSMGREGRAWDGCYLPTWVLQTWGGGFDFFTVGRGKVAVLVVRGPQLGLRPMGSALGFSVSLAGQPGHREVAGALQTLLCHHSS